MNETQNSFSTAQMLVIGATLQDGKYRIERYLSSGGFGNTYVVVNTVFDERYAMKEFFMKGISERDANNTTVSVSNAANENQFSTQKDKFKKEAQRLRKLRNQHLVFVHDFFEENGTAYYVMDFVEGDSISTILKQRRTPFDEKEALGILRQVLDALKVVHEKKIWHLDLKPGNIILDRNGNAVLIDFGASKQLSSVGGYTTTTTSMCYTPGYAPSEQIDQKMERIGPWTDLYALGATLYNMLSLHTPPSVSEVIDGDAFAFPDWVSDNVKQLVTWLMAPDRKRRPQSVDEVIAFLNTKDTPRAASAAAFAEEASDETVVGKPVARPAEKPSAEQKNEKPTAINKKSTVKKYFQIGSFIVGVLLIFAGPFLYNYFTYAEPDLAYSEADSAVVSVDSILIDGLGAGEYYGGYDNNREADDASCKIIFHNGRIYQGPIVHGTLTGENATFTFENGDVFEGSFKNNAFSQGKITLKEDGSYFVGTFANGQPSQGTWYDKNGKKL